MTKPAYGSYSSLEDIYASVGPGWRKLVEDLIKELDALGWDRQLGQIKEKFGGLRFYIDGYEDIWHESIEKAEMASYSICEKCSAPGTLCGEGWYVTLCEKCDSERKSALKVADANY